MKAPRPRSLRPFVVATPTEPFELISGWIPLDDSDILSAEPISSEDEHTRPTVPSMRAR
jgi:hypothetical protein